MAGGGAGACAAGGAVAGAMRMDEKNWGGVASAARAISSSS